MSNADSAELTEWLALYAAEAAERAEAEAKAQRGT